MLPMLPMLPMMRRLRRPTSLIVSLACLSGAAAIGCARATAPDPDADRRAIAAVREAYLTAQRVGAVGDIVSLHAAAAVVMPPGRPAVEGRDALREYEQAHHAAFAHPALEYDSAELVLAGDWAFDRGTERLTEAPKDGSPPREVTGNYLTVYRRQPDGAWKIARAIFNSSEDGVGGGSPFLLAQPCLSP